MSTRGLPVDTSPTSELAPSSRIGQDAVTFLTVYLVLLCAIPSYLTIPALGSVGRLSILWGLLGFVWWAFVRTRVAQPLSTGSSAVKVAALAFFGVMFLSYAAAQVQGLPFEGATTADSGLLRLLSWLGVLLVTLDGITSRSRYVLLLQRVVMAGALMAALGLLQFATGQSFVDSLSLPGFVSTGHFESVLDRGGFARSAATASHPLEYGAMLCVTLPLGLVLAVHDARRHWFMKWAPALIILLAVLLSMSRSTLLGVAFGLLILAPVVPARHRLLSVVLGSGLVAGISVVVPGMIGTLRGMFSDIGTDASTVSRTDSAGDALEIALRNPLIGQGFGTFLPQELIMDNHVLLLLIEGGILGLGAFAVLVAVSVIAAWKSRRSAKTPADRMLGPALAASVVAGSATLMFFDGLAFPISSGMLFFMIGVAGSSWVLRRPERPPGNGAAPGPTAGKVDAGT